MTQTEQTFIRPVGDFIEAFSKAAKLAGDLSNTTVQVTLTLEYLGLNIAVYKGNYKHKQIIGWLDLSESVSVYDIIETKIQHCLKSIDKEISEKYRTTKLTPVKERDWKYD